MSADWIMRALLAALSFGFLLLKIFVISLGRAEGSGKDMFGNDWAIMTSGGLDLVVLLDTIFIVFLAGLERRSGFRFSFPLMCFTSKEYFENHMANLSN